MGQGEGPGEDEEDLFSAKKKEARESIRTFFVSYSLYCKKKKKKKESFLRKVNAVVAAPAPAPNPSYDKLIFILSRVAIPNINL